jgi:hypothetical protein
MRMTMEAAANDRILVTTRARMWDTLDRLRVLRNRTVSAELVDQIDAVQVEGTRLARRLRVLGEPGLLTMRKNRIGRPAQLVCEAVAEVESECERRQIAIAIEPSPQGERSWLPAEATIEAVRSLLDEELATAAAHGTLRLRVTEHDASVRITIGHMGGAKPPMAVVESSDDGDATEGEVVASLVERSGGRLERTDEGTTLVLPAQNDEGRAEACERDSSPWIFPVPTAA